LQKWKYLYISILLYILFLKFLRKEGIKLTNTIDWKIVHEELYIKRKLSLKEISIKCKCSKTSVYKNFLRNKLKIRSLKEAMQLVDLNLENHPRWKGGTHIDKNGRILKCIGKGKYIQESIFNYLKFYNLEKIPEGYVIHHIDHNKLNNKIDNLKMLSRSNHTILHNQTRWQISIHKL